VHSDPAHLSAIRHIRGLNYISGLLSQYSWTSD
jgi:hypothetical protein